MAPSMTEDLDQLLDLATPWCLMVAATLRIPDLIAEGHHDLADLATIHDPEGNSIGLASHESRQ